MINIEKIEHAGGWIDVNKEDFLNFLHKHLEEYRDSRESIENALEYAFSHEPGKGGFLLAATQNGKVVGGVVINRTGMQGYIPENILVYIAVHKAMRGNGVGKMLMERAIQDADGNIALHVEYDNPARHLYQKVGFTTKYAEMRLEKKN